MQYNDGKVNIDRQEVSVFAGDYYQLASADTFDDFRQNRLQWESVPVTPETDVLVQALEKYDGEAFTAEKSNDGLTQDVFDAYMRKYIELLTHLIAMTVDRADVGQRGQSLRQLDALLRWKCCSVSREDWLMIPETHPMELAVRTFDRWIKAEQSGKDDLTDEILESQRRRRSRYMIYNTDQVYLRANDCEIWRGAMKGVPFCDAEKLTKISSVRLIEKIEHYINTRSDITEECVRVACLGEIEEPDKLGEFYRATTHYQVQLVQLKRDKDSSGLVFTITAGYPEEANRDSDRRMFNLLKLADLEALFKQYNIVLFMDEGCFYCQGQEGKSIEERMVRPQLEWILRAAEKETKKENRILYYRLAYNTAGEWLNSLSSSGTARMQFNEKLFKAIQSVMIPQYEVYLYVSYGKRIPVRELYNRDVCNDENYGGREVAVYKIPSQSKDISGEVAGFLKRSGKNEVKIDLWKIVKSISDDYYTKFLCDAGIEDEYQKIQLLRNLYLVISWPKRFVDGSKLEFWVEQSGNTGYYNQIGKFVQEMLEKGFLSVEHDCVEKYLHRLLGNAVSSRATDVEGILVGYLLKDGFFDTRVEWKGFIGRETVAEKRTGSSSQLFEPRRTILSVMSNLNTAWIQDYKRKREYLFYEFRNRYCPHLSEVVFEKLMRVIHDSCENLGYIDNRLYNHSEL